jgi:hypothetical protein
MTSDGESVISEELCGYQGANAWRERRPEDRRESSRGRERSAEAGGNPGVADRVRSLPLWAGCRPSVAQLPGFPKQKTRRTAWAASASSSRAPAGPSPERLRGPSPTPVTHPQE